MTVNVTTVQEAIRTALIDNIGVEVTVYTDEPEQPSYPCLIVSPDDPWVEFHGTFGSTGMVTFNWVVEVRVAGRPVDRQVGIGKFAGSGASGSIADALELDRTLGSTVHDTTVTTVSAPADRVEGAADITYLFVNFECVKQR